MDAKKLKVKIDDITQQIEAANEKIDYHEDRVKEYREIYEDLTQRWYHIAGKQQIIKVIKELERLFELVKVKDPDAMIEFVEYIRVVFVEQNVEGFDEFVQKLLEETRNKR